MTSRPGYHAAWLEQAVVTRLALPPLLPAESLAVVQSVLHTEHLPEPLVPEILTKAAGNPFFLEELAWSMVEHGPQQGPLTVPDTIQSVLAARIDRLLPAEKQLLQVAAVIGKELTFALLQAVTTLPEAALHTSLRRLQNAEFLYETHTVPVLTYTFKHALTQEVAYQSLLKSTRRQQHQTIAAVLETQFPDTSEIHPELLAHHYTEAGVAVAAVAYWQRAGRRAYERSANREAISYLTSGLELLQTLPDTSARLQQEILLQSTLGAAYTAARGYAAPEVEQAYNRARELCQQAGDTRQLFPILVGLWNFYFVRGASQMAGELGEQLCAMAQEAQDSTRLLRAHAALGEILFHTGNLAQARHHLEQGMALYNPHQHRSHAVQTPTVESQRVVQAGCQTAPLPDAVVQEILCRAEGNPFFREELVRAVSHDGMGQPRLGTVPDTIQGVLMARIDRLPDATRWRLQTAAVLGREAQNQFLTAVWSGPGDLEAHMQALQRLEFLYVSTEAGEPAYRFTHALTQEVAYESVTLPRRQVLHTAIGQALEAFYADRLEVVADRLAYHYTHGVEAHKAVTFLTLCAEQAVRTHAHAEPGPCATAKDTSNPTTSTELPNHILTSSAISPTPVCPYEHVGLRTIQNTL